jgi:tRNA(fMet)-specific endonuclease VapC
MKLLDTCFLIDLQREFKAGKTGDARKYLEQHPDTPFAVSVVSATEYLEGFGDIQTGERHLRSFRWLNMNPPVAREAAIIRRFLRLSGQLIGDFDILIAATAKATGIPLVTDNMEHFQRVEGLEVETYRK